MGRQRKGVDGPREAGQTPGPSGLHRPLGLARHLLQALGGEKGQALLVASVGGPQPWGTAVAHLPAGRTAEQLTSGGALAGGAASVGPCAPGVERGQTPRPSPRARHSGASGAWCGLPSAPPGLGLSGLNGSCPSSCSSPHLAPSQPPAALPAADLLSLSAPLCRPGSRNSGVRPPRRGIQALAGRTQGQHGQTVLPAGPGSPRRSRGPVSINGWSDPPAGEAGGVCTPSPPSGLPRPCHAEGEARTPWAGGQTDSWGASLPVLPVSLVWSRGPI